MKKREIIDKTIEYVKARFSGEGSGHDWQHVYRVWKIAVKIADEEGADSFTVQIAALLHDVADWKFTGGNEKAGSFAASDWLRQYEIEPPIIDHICKIVDGVSFKGAGVEDSNLSIEGMIVRDADRLDAIGAIGIARAFAYGGSRGREIYNPDIKPEAHETFEEYKNSKNTTINHFYEKLLLLKDRMHTKTARKIAEGRHQFMLDFLTKLQHEFEGKS